jgi:hypothetical protein
MTHNRLFVLATVGLLIGTAGGPSAADVRHERTERKPSIVEIGEPHSISMATLQREAGKISDLRDFIIRNGYPDYAEVQEVAPAWPWESYEVRVYYMQWNIEVDFGHVLFSDALADLGVEKFWGDITPEKRHEIEVILQARQAPPPAPPVVEPPPAMPAEPAPAEQGTQAPLQSSSHPVRVEPLDAVPDRASAADDGAVEQGVAAVRTAGITD